ncbi:hypothetical protein [Nonomuraea wenchangensis]|uniref:hypothetical protein n=1 Tax=Nonomuraea wenchangensis TaxID=568860 RepID=UPI0033213C8F
MLAGTAVAGLAAAAAVAVPLTLGSQSAAYAVVKQDDGTVQVTVREFRDPDGLEARLKAENIEADVTFTEADKQCAPGRFVGADLAYDPPSTKNMTEQERKEFDKPENWRSRDAARPLNADTFVISRATSGRGRRWCWSSGQATTREWAGRSAPSWPKPAARSHLAPSWTRNPMRRW